MKKGLALFAVFLMLFATIAPSPAWAAGAWHGGGHGGWHGGHNGGWHGGCCWWWPAAFVGGLALGAVALATAPFWAFAPPPPQVVEPAPAAYAQPVYAAAQPVYAAPPVSAAPAPAYTPSQPPPLRGEVVYENGRYLLFGDGVRHPWQWVWVPATAPPGPPMPPR